MKDQHHKKKTSCVAWGFGCLGIVIFAVSFALNGLLFFSFFTLTSGNTSDDFDYDEVVISYSETSQSKIVIIPIKGVIEHESQSADLFGSPLPSVESTIEQIRYAASDSRVVGILLDVDSPGGTVSASDVLYHEITKIKEETGLPIVSYYGEIAASGAYYVTAPSNEIIAEPSSLVGSIGVIFSGVNFTGLLNSVGVTEQVYKSGDHKDIFSSTRYPTPGDEEIIMSLVSDSYNQFTNIVKENRPIKQEDYARAFDGRVFSARDAQKIGLVDQIGYREDALNAVASRAEISDYSVVEYEQRPGLGSLFSSLGASLNKTSILDRIPNMIHEERPQLMYLWK